MCIYYTNSVKHAFLRNHSFPGWHRGKVLPHFQWSTIWGLSQLLDKLSWGLGAGILLWVLLMGQILLLFHRDYLLPIQETCPLQSAFPTATSATCLAPAAAFLQKGKPRTAGGEHSCWDLQQDSLKDLPWRLKLLTAQILSSWEDAWATALPVSQTFDWNWAFSLN